MKTHSQFVDEISRISPDIKILGIYTKSTERIKVRCSQCGHIWTPLAYSLSQGKSCPHCSAKRGASMHSGATALKTQEVFIAEMANKHPDIEVLGEYINGHTNINCKCKICSHQWEAKPYSLLQGHGCPRCAKSGTSFMEQFIRLSFIKVLGEESVLSRDRTTIGMELDIYIPSLKFAIEPGNWYLHQKSLQRDSAKRKLCSEKGIKLATIYDKFPTDLIPPFTENCFTFKEDLNRADHTLIKGLIYSLFKMVNIAAEFSDSDWDNIENAAYVNAKAKTHEDFLEELRLHHPNIEAIEKYQNSNKRILVQCKKCGYEWKAVPANLLAGDGCKKCGTKKAHKNFVKSQEEFEQQVAKANPDIQIIGKYTGRHNTVRAKCRICGYEWDAIASSLLRGSNHKGWKTMHQYLLMNIE